MLSLVSCLCVVLYYIIGVSSGSTIDGVCESSHSNSGTPSIPLSSFFFIITVFFLYGYTTTVNYYMRWNERKLFNSVSFVFLMATSYIPCQLARVLGSSNPKKNWSKDNPVFANKRRSR